MSGPLHIRGTVLPDGERADWWVRDGLLSAEPVPDAETVFTDGWIIPGLVDAHCHVGLGVHAATSLDEAVAPYRSASRRDTGRDRPRPLFPDKLGIGRCYQCGCC